MDTEWLRAFAALREIWFPLPPLHKLNYLRPRFFAHGDIELLKSRMRARPPADAAGRITYGARANAVKGRAPG